MDQVTQQLDLQMRASALQLAVSALQKDSLAEVSDVVPLAQDFYNFLKGAQA